MPRVPRAVSQVACGAYRETTLSRKGVLAGRRPRAPVGEASGLDRQEVDMRRRTIGVLAAVALALAGCTDNDTPRTEQSAGGSGGFPVTVGNVTVKAQPGRIVSLSPSATEMLFAVGAGKQVTAVDDQSNFPADAPKTDLSSFKPN